MKETTKEDLLSITAAHLNKITHLGERHDVQTLHLTPLIVVSVELIFSGNLEMLTAVYTVFDVETRRFKEIGVYDEELTTKLLYIKENGIEGEGRIQARKAL